jgi:beta-lactamase class D
MSSKLALLASAIGLSGCASAAPEPRISPSPAQTAAPAGAVPKKESRSAREARLTELPVAPKPELGRAFADEQVEGGIALFDSASGELFASDPGLAKRPFPPASTFKVPHAAIALELGILEDPESPMPWDGTYSSNPEWNRDHTLRTAMQVSCLPCFQRVAPKIGPERMREWLIRFDYGNHDPSGSIATFWLAGKLRITAVEQLDFLRRLDTGKLPISTRTLDMVRDVIALDVGPSHVLYGKTGLVGPPEFGSEVGWFVGFVALEKRSVYFATVVTKHPPEVDIKPVRRRVTETVLRSLDVLPSR